MALTLIGLLVTVAVFLTWTLATDPIYANMDGLNFAVYHEAAERWLGGGGYFLPDQLVGPYTTLEGHVMYPPVTLVLFVPFVYLPTFLWWAIPIGIVAWSVVVRRPGLWGWVGIAACVAWPTTVELVYAGNPVMWVAAIFALSLRWTWLGPLVLLKPSLFPFALAGVRTRAWWAVLGLFALVSLAFLPMWFDWLAVVGNAQGQFSGPLYSLKDVPMMLIPLVAARSSLSRRRG